MMFKEKIRKEITEPIKSLAMVAITALLMSVLALFTALGARHAA